MPAIGRAAASPDVAEYHPRMPDIVIVLIVVLIVVLVVRGPKTLPQLGEALGKAVSGARKAAKEGTDDEAARPDDQPRA